MSTTTRTWPPTPATTPGGARLAADIARLEAAEMLRVLLAHTPRLTVGDPEGVGSNFIDGIDHLPVRVGDR
jgi:cytochrome P450